MQTALQNLVFTSFSSQGTKEDYDTFIGNHLALLQDYFSSIFWLFMLTWLPNLEIDAAQKENMHTALKESYKRFYLSFVLKLPRVRIDQFQSIFPFFCCETVRLLVQQKQKDIKREWHSDGIYKDILSFIFTTTQLNFTIDPASLLISKSIYIKPADQL